MKISDYNYELPDGLIADRPTKIRGESRLLVLDRNTGKILDKKYSDVVNFLKSGDVLILNNTKVIKARLRVTKQNGAKRELVLLERHSFDNEWFRHRVLYRGKLSVGDKLIVDDESLIVEELLDGGIAIIKSSVNLLDLIETHGEVPLPPYMHRKSDNEDVDRYQTIWAKTSGSVAAPTASLNMTNEIIERLINNGVKIAYVTLHVGLGTFLPIRSDNVEDHKMHQEYFEIPKETIDLINQAKSKNNRIVALGTTVTRALEYSADNIKKSEVDLTGEADIFIYPGYKFKVIDCLLTNYHAPKSTVLMLAAAFAGWDNLLSAYNHAIQERYHFLSYGDSMLII